MADEQALNSDMR